MTLNTAELIQRFQFCILFLKYIVDNITFVTPLKCNNRKLNEKLFSQLGFGVNQTHE